MATSIERAVELILKTVNCEGLYLSMIHDLDHVGSLQGTIEWRNHSMEITNYWENCGVVGEDVLCNCGFRSSFFSGNGCWQCGHDGPPEEHSFDFLHNAMYLAAQKFSERNLTLQN